MAHFSLDSDKKIVGISAFLSRRSRRGQRLAAAGAAPVRPRPMLAKPAQWNIKMSLADAQVMHNAIPEVFEVALRVGIGDSEQGIAG